MYGLINKITATKDKRGELAKILMEGLKNMPGNLSYIVAEDTGDDITLWVTEVWQDKASHEASLSLTSVQEAINKGRPLITGLDRISETLPLGGRDL